MNKLATAWAGDRARAAVIGLISVVVGVPLACGCIAGALALGNGLAAVDERWAPVFLIGLMVAGLAATPVVVFAPLAWSVNRRARWLDGVFGPLGLTGGLYVLKGRQYRGVVGGREVDLRFYQGPTLEIYVTTPLMTRLSVAEKSAVIPALAKAFKRAPLELGDPALSGLSVFALDGEWARTLLAQPEARAIVLRLMQASQWALLRQVHLQPGAFLLRLYRNTNVFRYDIAPPEGQQWVYDLIALARVAESMPAPQVTEPVSSAERLVRSGKIGRATLPITIGMTLALIVGLPLCAVLITVVLLALDK